MITGYGCVDNRAGIAVFRRDVNLREIEVPGLVGAGGMGLQLQLSLNLLA
jgi:phosphonate transport system permease protein